MANLYCCKCKAIVSASQLAEHRKACGSMQYVSVKQAPKSPALSVKPETPIATPEPMQSAPTPTAPPYTTLATASASPVTAHSTTSGVPKAANTAASTSGSDEPKKPVIPTVPKKAKLSKKTTPAAKSTPSTKSSTVKEPLHKKTSTLPSGTTPPVTPSKPLKAAKRKHSTVQSSPSEAAKKQRAAHEVKASLDSPPTPVEVPAKPKFVTSNTLTEWNNLPLTGQIDQDVKNVARLRLQELNLWFNLFDLVKFVKMQILHHPMNTYSPQGLDKACFEHIKLQSAGTNVEFVLD
ncbi:hypothetical protein IWQ60_008121 [Tieghemiomyces parasiticus]|uniref:Uncharacterized protein n=1 Tax=Tieghemiomyces parasiticus TaxID=78921 RepID=A0A9W7ZU09_9FUNG|nr:hypothetical protein IWQ60_008121 [Tieghemiomyces parasiticus]